MPGPPGKESCDDDGKRKTNDANMMRIIKIKLILMMV